MDYGFDHVGVLTRAVRANTRALEVLAGGGPPERLSARPPQLRGIGSNPCSEAVDRAVDDLTVGGSDGDAAVDETVRSAVEGLTALDVDVVDVSVPNHRLAPAVVGVTASIGVASTYRQSGVGTTTLRWH